VCYCVQESTVVHIGFDGRRTGTETYRLKMRCAPVLQAGRAGDECTVREFSIRTKEGQVDTIPELGGWSYVFRQSPSGMDDKKQIFGIPHDKFENLTTSRGTKLSAIASYPVYSSFVDFHSLTDVFARPSASGGGIQDLRTVGQQVVHAAAFTEPPVNMGSGIKEGSVFRNGEAMLVLKGVGLVDGAACAVVGYDSGESTLKMIMPFGAGADIETVGGSQYAGDIYVDLATRWVRRAALDEFVITETRVPAFGQSPGQKIQAYTVRHLLTRLISREEYER
jgi:hypothetical protein